MKLRKDITGQRFGRLVVLGHAGMGHRNNGDTFSMWRVLCDCGTVKVLTGGNIGGSTHSCGCLYGVKQKGARRTTAPTYSGAHRRVRSVRGSAKNQLCIDCLGPAREWSYDHEDPNQLQQVVNGYEVTYSADPAHYQPRCRSCHLRSDFARKRGTATEERKAEIKAEVDALTQDGGA